MKNIITFIGATLLLTAMSTGISFAGKPSGGGGGKVSVEAADPSTAIQGEVKDIYITGSGFGPGASVKYLVTGTTDNTQIEVLSTEYIESTGELKTNVKVKDSAAVSDYDIEVQAASGRKGKGTTLFKVQTSDSSCSGSEPTVQIADVSCTGYESKIPAIVYLTDYQCVDGVLSADIMFSSESGCDQYLIVEAAQQKLPDQQGQVEPLLSEAFNLRLDTHKGHGIVTWLNRQASPIPVMGLRFELDALGQPIVDPLGPQALYVPASEDWKVRSTDVRINDADEVELVLSESLVNDTFYRQMVVANIDLGTREIISQQPCESDPCFSTGAWPWWNSDGTEIYFDALDPETMDYALARYRRIATNWNLELVTSDDSGWIVAADFEGLFVYGRTESILNKGGKPIGRENVTRVIDPETCVPTGCLVADGARLPLPADHDPVVWTADGGLLVGQLENGKYFLEKYSDPWNGVLSTFRIGPVPNGNVDASY